MILQGTALALVGMTVVFIFLFLLVMIVEGTSRVLAPETARELSELEKQRAEQAQKSRKIPLDRRRLIAAISTAVAAFRAGRKMG